MPLELIRVFRSSYPTERMFTTEEGTAMNLGDKVRDHISGFEGFLVAKHEYLNGCARFTVQPPVDKEGKLPPTETFDEMQLEVIESKTVKRAVDTGGPEKYPDVRRY